MSINRPEFRVLLAVSLAFVAACTGGSGTSEAGRVGYEEVMGVLADEGAAAAQSRLEELTQAMEGGDQNAFLEVAKGRVLDALGSRQPALDAYARAIELDPELSEGHYFLAVAQLNAFEYEEALVAAERAVELDPENGDYVYMAAQLYDRTSRYQQAEEAWNFLLERSPDDPRYLVPLAGLQHRIGNVPEALALLDRAGSLEGDDPMIAMARQLAAQLRGESEQQVELQQIEAALRFTPADPRLLGRRAELLIETDNPAGAEEAIREAISIEPDNAEHHFVLAQALDRLDDTAGALAATQRAVELDPDNVGYRLSLGGLQWQMRDVEAARESLRMVIEMAPESEEAHFAQEQLLRMGG
jgi:tetratricopeptide (TPR) repeat protein